MDMRQEVLENGFYDLRRDPETSQSPSGYSFLYVSPVWEIRICLVSYGTCLSFDPENGKTGFICVAALLLDGNN